MGTCSVWVLRRGGDSPAGWFNQSFLEGDVTKTKAVVHEEDVVTHICQERGMFGI